MLRTFLLLISLLCAPVVLAGECIDVESTEISAVDSEFGITTAELIADIRNHCDEPYDATLTIMLIDKHGDVVHESLEIVIVDSRGLQTTRQTMSIPEDDYDSIERIEVSIEERVRPI